MNQPAHPSPHSKRKLATILAVVTFVLAFGLRSGVRAREDLNRLTCLSHLKGFATSAAIYGTAVPPATFVCPTSGASNYVYLGPAGVSFENATIIAYEPKSNHGEGGAVLFGDGHCIFLRGDSYDDAMAKVRASSQTH